MRIVVRGETYDAREILNRAGFLWRPKAREWFKGGFRDTDDACSFAMEIAEAVEAELDVVFPEIQPDDEDLDGSMCVSIHISDTPFGFAHAMAKND